MITKFQRDSGVEHCNSIRTVCQIKSKFLQMIYKPSR
jgi:hypothetical protein